MILRILRNPTYTLGDKQFQSTGDIKKDIELIRENFPDVDVSALEESLLNGGDFSGELASPEKNQLKTEFESLQSAVNDAIASGDTKRVSFTSKSMKAWLDSHPDFKKDQAGPKPLSEKADVRKYVNDLIAADDANRVLESIRSAKQGVNTGEWRGRLFDSSVPQYDQAGNQKPAGLIDSAITTIFPKDTEKMRLLDAALQRASNYAFEKGGKSLTGSEKTAIFNQVPNRFDDDPVFDNVLTQSRQDLDQFIDNRVKVLKGLGYNEDSILNLLPVKSGENSFLKQKIIPQASQAQQAPQTQPVSPFNINQTEIDKILKQRGIK